jgi:hypothetical protein
MSGRGTEYEPIPGPPIKGHCKDCGEDFAFSREFRGTFTIRWNADSTTGGGALLPDALTNVQIDEGLDGWHCDLCGSWDVEVTEEEV